MKKEFIVDHRDNTGLHRLYVQYALEALVKIDVVISHLVGDTSLCNVILTLIEQRDKLVEEDAAYHEANNLMRIIRMTFYQMGVKEAGIFTPQDADMYTEVEKMPDKEVEEKA